MSFTLVALHKRGASTVGVRLVEECGKEYKVHDVAYAEFKSKLSQGIIDVTNVKVELNKLVGTNGQLSRYGVLYDGVLAGNCPVVVLMEMNNKCYKVSNPLGQIAVMDTANIVRYASTEGIANGKVVRNSDGTCYISSINGEYKKDLVVTAKKQGNILKAKMQLLGEDKYVVDENYMASWNKNSDSNDDELIIGSGCLGIKANGFSGSPFRTIQLPDTLEVIEPGAFKSMKNLEKLVIPNGVKVIPTMMCAGCTSLKEVRLPNSVERVDGHAFNSCRNLKLVEAGTKAASSLNKLGVIPSGTVVRYRRG